ncbi:MAG: sigma-70 family RNA polymerase sigma factor [Bacteroidales bacterium]|nr:sigma-70 family RNA polymerase sigma factor [Bacteroidales bacterium]
MKHQEMLYRQFYAYGMSITLRYTKSREEAIEVLNDSFLKVFNNIKKFDINKSFKSWFRQITVNTSIDYYRKSKRMILTDDIENYESATFDTTEINELEVEDILKLLNSIPEHYAVIFNLYEIEGFDHNEIAEKLNISDSTSRANLSRAKKMLRELYAENFHYKDKEYVKVLVS